MIRSIAIPETLDFTGFGIGRKGSSQQKTHAFA
jgi:hypothetical protein